MAHLLLFARRYFRDPKTYPNPEVFSPQRFMCESKQFDPRKRMFGYGRRCVSVVMSTSCQTTWELRWIRVCPGIHLADASMWLLCMSVLAMFDVVPPVKHGEPLVSPGKFSDGAIRCVLNVEPRTTTLGSRPALMQLFCLYSHPIPFECVITPRSPGAEALVRGLSRN